MTSMLAVTDVSLSFRGVRALSGVTFAIGEREMVGIIGPNGSGKSTLFNVISGVYRAESGMVTFCAAPISNLPPADIVSRGLARTFQNKRLFGSMTVFENVLTAAVRNAPGGVIGDLVGAAPARRGMRESEEFAHVCLARVGLSAIAQSIARDLPFGAQNRLEIARALAARPKLLLLDEPAAGLNPEERQELRALIESVFSEGISVLLVEHDVRLVTSLCERVIALDHGEKIADGRAADVIADSRVQEAYFGPADDAGAASRANV